MLAHLWSWMRPRRRPLSRAAVARVYLCGSGIEVGALHRPLRVPPDVTVRYVDRLSLDELREQYPTLSNRDLLPVDIVDDGERLTSVPDTSQDFVIANHFLEHCEDPLGALLNFLRVLRDGGVLFLTVPDKRYTFDRDRPVTPLPHLIADHECGPDGSRHAHLAEWARLVLKEPDGSVADRVAELEATGFSIHYHVWTQRELMELLLEMRQRIDFEVELFLKRAYEVIVILRKGAPTADDFARNSAPTHLPGF